MRTTLNCHHQRNHFSIIQRGYMKFKGIILIIFSLMIFYGCEIEQNPKKITQQRFENDMLKNHDVEKLKIVNQEEVEVYIKKDRLEQPQYRNISKQEPQFYFTIYSPDYFEMQLKEIQKDFQKDEYVDISYTTRNSYFAELFLYLLPLILIVLIISWIIILVDILRSNFKNSIDKLIWLIVITLIPILGLLLYIIIGRKQKIKNAP